MNKLVGCLSVMVFCLFAHEARAEYVVGEEAVIQFQLDRQTSQSKCNIRVTLADGSNIDVQIDPPRFVASLRFIPSIAGNQVIQWEGKTKFRGLKSTGGCSGSGSFVVEVRDRAEVIAERERARKAEEARQREEAIEAKYKPWADYVASLSGDIRECMLEGNHLLIENTRVYDDIMPLMRAVAELEIDGAMTNGGQMLGYFVESCETFISTERQWTGQAWGDPPAEVSCISPQSARCTPFYVVEIDTGWAKATWRDALKAHLNDKRWDTALEETAESFKQRCERNSLADRGCPGYAEAKAEQDRIEAEREKERQRIAAEKEKERQKELAQQRKREEEQRKREEEERRRLYELANKPLTKQTLKRGITYKWYHDGSCTQSDTELCVSKQNYEFLCREATKSEAITRSAIGLAGSYSDRIWSFLANNGRLRVIEISSGDRGNYSCHVTIEMVGIYEGSQYIKRQSASVTSFVLNNDNEVMITSTSSYHW